MCRYTPLLRLISACVCVLLFLSFCKFVFEGHGTTPSQGDREGTTKQQHRENGKREALVTLSVSADTNGEEAEQNKQEKKVVQKRTQTESTPQKAYTHTQRRRGAAAVKTSAK